MSRVDRIELASSSKLSDGLDLDLGVDDDLAMLLKETEGVNAAESPLLSERLAVREHIAEPVVGLLLDRELDLGDLADHFSRAANIQASLVFMDAELVEFAGDISKQRVDARTDLSQRWGTADTIRDEIAADLDERHSFDPEESPLVGEQLDATALTVETATGLAEGSAVDDGELRIHLETLADLARSSLIKEVELVAAAERYGH